jgi:hypothetical protein
MIQVIKKMICSTVLAAGISVLFSGSAMAGGVLKLGFDSAGSMEVTGSGTTLTKTYDANSGVSLAFEGHGAFGANVDLGGGIEFQSYRELTLYPGGGSFQFVPIYLLMRLHPEMSDITPYLAMQLGFSIFNADSKFTGNGFYTTKPGSHGGIGAGVILDKNFLMELMATVDTGGLQHNNVQVLDVSYSKVTLSIGLYF